MAVNRNANGNYLVEKFFPLTDEEAEILPSGVVVEDRNGRTMYTYRCCKCGEIALSVFFIIGWQLCPSCRGIVDEC